MSRLDGRFDEYLADRARCGLRRTLSLTQPGAPGQVRRDHRALLNFSANDYLGLATHPAQAHRAADWAARFGTGAGASRLVTGTLEAHLRIEARVAGLKHTEAALILASGWQANAAALPALLRLTPDPLVFADQFNHASLAHGCRAAGLRPIRFRHNDLDHLEALLRGHASHIGQRFIVTETVFSMDGDVPDLPRLRALADAHDAFLYLDEAHATGVLGPGGAGLAHAAGGADLVMGTFSKALGSFGAYIAGSRALIDYLINACSGFIYTTALPPPVLGAIDAALDVLPTLDEARSRLAGNASRVRAEFAALGMDTGNSTTQIVPALIGNEAETMALAAGLQSRGILAVPIRPPTVPAGTARLRFALSAAHDDAAIESLLAAMLAVFPRRRAA